MIDTPDGTNEYLFSLEELTGFRQHLWVKMKAEPIFSNAYWNKSE